MMWHALYFLYVQNASSNFKIVMVATGIEDESTASNLVMARDYASGRNLPLIEVNLSTGTNVSESFDKIVEMAMAVHGKQQEINGSQHSLETSPLLFLLFLLFLLLASYQTLYVKCLGTRLILLHNLICTYSFPLHRQRSFRSIQPRLWEECLRLLTTQNYILYRPPKYYAYNDYFCATMEQNLIT